MLGKLFSKPQASYQQDPLLSLLKVISTYMVVYMCLITASTAEEKLTKTIIKSKENKTQILKLHILMTCKYT